MNKQQFKYQLYRFAYLLSQNEKYASKSLKYLVPTQNYNAVYSFMNRIVQNETNSPDLTFQIASLFHKMGKPIEANNYVQKYGIHDLPKNNEEYQGFSSKLSLYFLEKRLNIFDLHQKGKIEQAADIYQNIINTDIDNILKVAKNFQQKDQKNPIVFDNQERQKNLIDQIKQLNKQGKSFAIIGNGPSLKDQNLGSIIDEYDYIVRVNNYNITGFEKDVGHKINLWGTAASEAYRGIERDIFPENTLTFLNRKTRKNGRLFELIEKAAERLEISSNQLIMLDHSNQMQIEYYSLYPNPCSGLRLIIWLTQVLKVKVSIFGFDFFQSTNTHYYDKEVKSHEKHGDQGKWYSNHDFKWENALTDILMYQGKLKRY